MDYLCPASASELEPPPPTSVELALVPFLNDLCFYLPPLDTLHNIPIENTSSDHFIVVNCLQAGLMFLFCLMVSYFVSQGDQISLSMFISLSAFTPPPQSISPLRTVAGKLKYQAEAMPCPTSRPT